MAGRSILVIFAAVTCSMLQWNICEGSTSENLKIASFNIQVFGRTKMSKPDVVKQLVKIASRYDIFFMQEIRDISGVAIQDFLEDLNTENPDNPFSMKLSERLGRTSSKEQYAYLYRENSGLTVTQDYVFNDDTVHNDGTSTFGPDVFEREPYVVTFESTKTALKKFVFIGIHVSPGTAVEEIKGLEVVFDDARNRTQTDDTMLMGDLNAGCSYVADKDWPDIDIFADQSYTWLIPNSADTTTSNSDCPYDRFVMTGDGLKRGYVTGSARVFRFDTTYGLNETLTKLVSDHYPIEFELKGSEDTNGSGFSVHARTTCLGLVAVLASLTLARI